MVRLVSYPLPLLHCKLHARTVVTHASTPDRLDYDIDKICPQSLQPSRCGMLLHSVGIAFSEG